MIIRIATRKSPLALWQANNIYDLISAVDRSLKVFLVPVSTKADQDLTLPIKELGGKGAFSKGVQNVVLSGQADIAVHSAKDLQAKTPDGLRIGAFPVRGEITDCLVGSTMKDLPNGATVATGSRRREILLLEQRPDLKIVGLRGGIDTRLKKLDEVDAIVMATVALKRLGKDLPVVQELDPEMFIPQVGQGALAVEARSDDYQILDILAAVDHRPTGLAVSTERKFLAELGGDCDMPAGAHAFRHGNDLRVRGFLGDAAGAMHRGEQIGAWRADPGRKLAASLKQAALGYTL